MLWGCNIVHSNKIESIKPEYKSIKNCQKTSRSLQVDDYVDYGCKTWRICGISETGLVALKNISSKSPASIVIPPNQVQYLVRSMGFIKR